ncbi:MAG: hypothetical protein ABI165_20170, partial [Bryobacteraceae bacterium]
MKRTLLLIPMLAVLLTAGCAARVAYFPGAPPPPRAEVYGYAPGPGYAWVSGYWDLHGRGNWVWAQGYWAHPPHPSAYWVRSRWDRGPRGYVFVRGHW